MVMPKGGAGKTTAAAHIAHAEHERGRRVFAVDADPQGSLFEWHQRAGFPFPAVTLPTDQLDRQLAGMVAGQYDTIVIDTPGRADGRAVAVSAIRAATHVLIPVAPTGIEIRELRVVRRMLVEATRGRAVDALPEVGVLFVRVVAGAGSTAGFRAGIEADAWPVLRPEVRRLERFAQAFPHPITGACQTGYGDAVTELLDRG